MTKSKKYLFFNVIHFLNFSHDRYTEDCQLGEQRTYQRLKKESVCYNGREYVPSQNAKPCKCTLWDFKCDFGYKRKGKVILLIGMNQQV